jgi:hypothetical protein
MLLMRHLRTVLRASFLAIAQASSSAKIVS